MTLPFRAIISNLDGTLLNANHKIGDFTIDTLEQLSKKVLIFFSPPVAIIQMCLRLLGK